MPPASGRTRKRDWLAIRNRRWRRCRLVQPIQLSRAAQCSAAACQPALAEHGNMPESAAAEDAEAKMLVLSHLGVPAWLFVRPHQAHLYLAERELALPHSATWRTSEPDLSSPPPSCFATPPPLPNIEKPRPGPWALAQRVDMSRRKCHPDSMVVPSEPSGSSRVRNGGLQKSSLVRIP